MSALPSNANKNTANDRFKGGKNFVVVVFVLISLVAMFDLPKIIIWNLNISLSVFYPSFPHLAPFCMIILYYNMLVRSGSKSATITIATSDVLMLTTISTLLLLEILHSAATGKFDAVVVLSYFWIFFFMLLLCTFDYFRNYEYIISIITIFVITALSALQVVSYLNIGYSELIPKYQYGYTPAQLFIPESSYRSTLCVCIILFSSKWRHADLRMRAFYTLCLSINILLIFMNSSRSGVFILIILSFIFLSRIFLRSWRNIFDLLRKDFGTFTIIILALLTSLAVAMAVWPIYESGLDLQRLIQRIYELLTFQRGFVGDESTVIRVQSAKLAVNAFLENPTFGIGYAAFLTDRYNGFVSHTHLVNVLAAYGLIGGGLAVASLIGFALERGRLLSAEKVALLVALLVPLATDPDVRWWYAIPLYFLRRAGPDPAVPAARTAPLQT